MNLYKTFLKPVLFSFDAEKVHDAVTFLGESLESFGDKICQPHWPGGGFWFFKTKKYVSYFELNISCPNTAMSEGFAIEKSLAKMWPLLALGESFLSKTL